MFSFFKFSYKNLLKEEPNRYDIVRNMRKKKLKQKDFDSFKQSSYIIGSDENTDSRVFNFFKFINNVFDYKVYGDVRNKYDLDFYISDIKKLIDQGSLLIGKQQLKIIQDSLENSYPMLISYMKKETEKETIRKEIIEKAGMKYTRHIYPDFSGSDELFYDMPSGSEDIELEKAKQIIEEKNKNNQKATC